MFFGVGSAVEVLRRCACLTPFTVLRYWHYGSVRMTKGGSEAKSKKAEERGWRWVYYKSSSGRVPVKEFVEAQEVKVRAKIFADLERLVRENVRLGAPFASKLAGQDFWELRTKAPGGDIYRTFYFALTGRKFVLLHAFQKKSQKTPNEALELAERRMKDYLERSQKRRSKKGNEKNKS